MISVSRNILANYISQVYVTLIGIVMLPLYIRYMGAEAYGLVGFFTMLQMWFSLLDLGLTPTMAREAARFRGGALDPVIYRRFVRTLEGVFLLVAVVCGASLFAASGLIATHWLDADALSHAELKTSIQIMAIIVALRWLGGLYRGAISGTERLVWLSGCNATIATLRFLGILPVLIYVSASPVAFFTYQLGVAVVELIALSGFVYRLLPVIPGGIRVTWSWTAIKPSIRFSLTIAITSSIWILLTQTDRLILSTLLSLEEYAYFILAVIVAGAIMMVSAPLSTAIMPRMVKLETEGANFDLIQLYRRSTQFVAAVGGSAAITLFLFAEQILWAWTGDVMLAAKVAPVMMLYVVGNGLLVVSAFPYYLQYAKGDLRLHLIGNVVFALLLVPLIVFAASRWGSIGAGYVWLGMNLLVFVAWLPFIHSRFVPGLNRHWYTTDTVLIFLSSSLAGYGLKLILPEVEGRGMAALEVLLAGVIILTAGVLASSQAWQFVRKRIAAQQATEV